MPKNDKRKTLAELLTEKRNEFGLRRPEVARLAGIPVESLRRVEEGITLNPTLDTIARLAKVYRVSIDVFVADGVVPITEARERLKDAA